MTVHLSAVGQGQPLVLFHGWGFDSQVWAPLLPRLAALYQVILVDLPGFGLSPCMDWAACKDSLLQALPKTFALVGWSMGGLYAMRLAVEAPARVKALVSVAASPRFLADGAWPGVAAEVLENFYRKLLGNAEATLQEFLTLQGLGACPQIRSRGFSTEGLAQGLQVLKTWDLRQSLHTLQVPACFLFGKRDAITPAKTMAAMQALYPLWHYRLFARAAHVPFLTQPEDFIHTVTEFVQ